MRIFKRIFTIANRKMIEPQIATITPIDDRYHITSQMHDFVIAKKPQSDLIYVHDAGTPSAVLKKQAIHIIPETVPEVNRREKISAVTKQFQANYQGAFKKCMSPKQIFHLERRIKGQIRNKLSYIGCITGKYKHLMAFRSLHEINAENTLKQYQKNGVFVQKLNEQIYPSGKVWMPTSQKYLTDYCTIVGKIPIGKQIFNMLDMGCGSGVLSFIFAKNQKKSKIYALDKNNDAVKTTNVNAARLEYRNIEAFQFDLNDYKQFQVKTMQYRLPKLYDWIMINPPWLSASRLQGDSGIGDGVYDDGSKMLQNSISLAKRLLQRDGRIVVIYSDLSHILGLGGKTVQDLCVENNLIIQQKLQQPFLTEMAKKSALQQYKNRSKIITYLIKHS